MAIDLTASGIGFTQLDDEVQQEIFTSQTGKIIKKHHTRNPRLEVSVLLSEQSGDNAHIKNWAEFIQDTITIDSSITGEVAGKPKPENGLYEAYTGIEIQTLNDKNDAKGDAIKLLKFRIVRSEDLPE